jgi:hypothetical protein
MAARSGGRAGREDESSSPGGHQELGTFETAHKAARVYDAVAWRLGRPHRSMNFDDVTTRARRRRCSRRRRRQ